MFSDEYRAVDFIVRQALVNAIKQNGEIEFPVKLTRQIDYKGVRHFVLEYLPSAKASDYVVNTLIEVLINNEPSRYLSRYGAGLLGVNVGAKTSRSVLKFLKRNGFDVDKREYCMFADAISPVSRVFTYKVELTKYDKYGGDYDMLKFSRNEHYVLGTTAAKVFDITRSIEHAFPTPMEFYGTGTE